MFSLVKLQHLIIYLKNTRSNVKDMFILYCYVQKGFANEKEKENRGTLYILLITCSFCVFFSSLRQMKKTKIYCRLRFKQLLQLLMIL